MSSRETPVHPGVMSCTLANQHSPTDLGNLRCSQEDFLVCMKGRMVAVLTEADAVGRALVGPTSDGADGTTARVSL